MEHMSKPLRAGRTVWRRGLLGGNWAVGRSFHLAILSLFKYFFHYLILFKAFVLSNTLQLSVQGSSVTASTPVPLLPLVQFLCLYVKFDIKFNFDSDLIEKSSLHELRQEWQENLKTRKPHVVDAHLFEWLLHLHALQLACLGDRKTIINSSS